MKTLNEQNRNSLRIALAELRSHQKKEMLWQLMGSSLDPVRLERLEKENGSLLQVASVGNKDIAVLWQLIVADGTDVNEQGGKYGSALQAASYLGHVAVVKALVLNGANVNIGGGEYGHPLQAAAMGLRQLIDGYAPHVNVGADNLQLAASKGYSAFVWLLMDRGVKLGALEVETHKCIRRVAQFQGIRGILIKNGADVSVLNETA